MLGGVIFGSICLRTFLLAVPQIGAARGTSGIERMLAVFVVATAIGVDVALALIMAAFATDSVAYNLPSITGLFIVISVYIGAVLFSGDVRTSAWIFLLNAAACAVASVVLLAFGGAF